MSADASEATSSVYLRPSTRDLGDLPMDPDLLNQACASLSARQLAAWLRLVRHLWCHGELPATPRRLAEICGVGVKTFLGMMPALAPLFDHDHQGRWHDVEMEAERDRRLQLEPGERISFEAAPGAIVAAAGPDPELSEKRRRAGKAGSEARWADRRRRLQLLQGGKADANDGNHSSGAMANVPSENGKTNGGAAAGLPSTDATNLPSLDSQAYGPSDGLSSSLSLDEIEESDGRTDAPASDASHGKSHGTPDGKNDRPPDGKSVADSNGKTACGADGKTAPDADSERGDGKPDAAAAVALAIADTDLIARLRKAGGAKIPAELLTRAAIAPVRDLMALCDFEADILPAVKAVLPGLTTTLRSWRAAFLHEAAIARRDERVSAADAPSGLPPPVSVFVRQGSPQWRAWADTGRKMPTWFQRKQDRATGWYFATEWPPGVERRSTWTGAVRILRHDGREHQMADKPATSRGPLPARSARHSRRQGREKARCHRSAVS